MLLFALRLQQSPQFFIDVSMWADEHDIQAGVVVVDAVDNPVRADTGGTQPGKVELEEMPFERRAKQVFNPSFTSRLI